LADCFIVGQQNCYIELTLFIDIAVFRKNRKTTISPFSYQSDGSPREPSFDTGLKFGTPPPAARSDNIIIRESDTGQLSTVYYGQVPVANTHPTYCACRQTICSL